MGRFRLKRSLYTRGGTHIHEMRDHITGQLRGRVVLWAESQIFVSELVEDFLVGMKILPRDWREDDEGRDGPMNPETDGDPVIR